MPDVNQLRAAEEEARLALVMVETGILPAAWLERIAAYRTAVERRVRAEDAATVSVPSVRVGVVGAPASTTTATLCRCGRFTAMHAPTPECPSSYIVADTQASQRFQSPPAGTAS